jgi:hypothetical protein
LGSLPREHAIDIAVKPNVGMVPGSLAAALPVRIDLLTDPREGWFTLLPETVINLQADGMPK